MPSALATDYLVIGAGATAMAFVDSLLTEQPDADVVMVDRHHRPGGHWNDAYPYVRLHQPSHWYGVASRELSHGTVDATGFNAGLYGLASGAEVLAHFDQVMNQRFLPSGRVRWMPMSEYDATGGGEHRVRSLTGGGEQTIAVRKKLVDVTHARTEVPATHPPKFEVAAGVTCVPPNGLPKVSRPYAAYTVVGSGKTGMDACLWLLENGVSPDAIRWIMPRDPWMFNRADMQPGLENYERSMSFNSRPLDTIAQAASLADLFERLEAQELLMRLDRTVQPTTFRCAVVSPAELAALRRIRQVIRMGHLRRIEPEQLVLDQGTVPADPDTLYINCTASAIIHPPKVPVFDGDRINVLMVRTCQPLFSAALIAYVESHVTDVAEQNSYCTVVPSPEKPIDWLRMYAASLRNAGQWRKHAGLHAWLMKCRLNSIAVLLRDVKPDDTERIAMLQALGPKAAAAGARIPALLAEAQSATV